MKMTTIMKKMTTRTRIRQIPIFLWLEETAVKDGSGAQGKAKSQDSEMHLPIIMVWRIR